MGTSQKSRMSQAVYQCVMCVFGGVLCGRGRSLVCVLSRIFEYLNAGQTSDIQIFEYLRRFSDIQTFAKLRKANRSVVWGNRKTPIVPSGTSAH